MGIAHSVSHRWSSVRMRTMFGRGSGPPACETVAPASEAPTTAVNRRADTARVCARTVILLLPSPGPCTMATAYSVKALARLRSPIRSCRGVRRCRAAASAPLQPVRRRDVAEARDGTMFDRGDGRPVDPDAFGAALRRAREAAALDGVRSTTDATA